MRNILDRDTSGSLGQQNVKSDFDIFGYLLSELDKLSLYISHCSILLLSANTRLDGSEKLRLLKLKRHFRSDRENGDQMPPSTNMCSLLARLVRLITDTVRFRSAHHADVDVCPMDTKI